MANSSNHLVFLFTLALAVVLDLLILWASRRYFKRFPLSPESAVKPVYIGKKVSPSLTLLKITFARLLYIPIKFTFSWVDRILKFLKRMQRLPRLPSNWVVLGLEILVILLWAGYAGRELLNPDPDLWANGQDFPLAIRENYFWKDLFRCGTCALWNGRMNGGLPALIDTLDAPLHPLVALPAIFLGVIYGGRVSVVLGLALAGLAQLWLGYELGLGKTARIWSALLAVVAGTLVGRMEIGLVTMVISLATCTLIIPAGIRFARRPTWRGMVILAVILALSILSGQGYAQLGIAFAILPALLILFARPLLQFWDLLKKLVVSAGLALAICGIMLVPLLVNAHAIEKITDEGYAHIQPLEYQPINLIVRDLDFYGLFTLGKSAATFIFSDYIGWVPLLFAALALRLVPRERLRTLLFFLTGIVLVYLTSSLVIPRLMFDWWNHEFLVGLRHAPMIAGLAGPLILGLAAWGIDLALKSSWQISNLRWKEIAFPSFRPLWFLLVLPLVASVVTVYDYNRVFLGTIETDETLSQAVPYMKTPSAQWVEMPPDHYWNLYAFEHDAKLANAFMPWYFRDFQLPDGRIRVVEEDPAQPEMTASFRLNGLAYFYLPWNEYAAITDTSQNYIPCQATSIGGKIDMVCPDSRGGELVVKEHNWSGWAAYVDGKPAPIVEGTWLRLYLPPGSHVIQFRYIPADTLVGFAVSVIGILLMALIWYKARSS